VKKLRELGVDWLVVHNQESKEYYHDFVFPDKFEAIEGLERIDDEYV